MNKIFLILSLLLCSQAVIAQKVFTEEDDVVKLYKGETIRIETDSAFVIDHKRAIYLNARLEDLNQLKQDYDDVSALHSELIREIDQIESTINKMISRSMRDASILDKELADLFKELDLLIDDLDRNNSELEKNNSALSEKVKKMDEININLKRINRGIWWNGVSDKLFSLGIGLAIGVTVGIMVL